jgi:hypothetical protein
VVAEVQKGRGTKLRLAFAAGLYDAIVSETAKTTRVLRCKLSLTDGRITSLDLGGCQANEVPLPGAFRLTGVDPMVVCVVWSEHGPVDRSALRQRAPNELDGAVCATLAPAP